MVEKKKKMTKANVSREKRTIPNRTWGKFLCYEQPNTKIFHTLLNLQLFQILKNDYTILTIKL
jgi:phosphatidate phosphatase APP1